MTTKKTDAIIILDGFGYTAEEKGNAVKKSGIPNITAYLNGYPHTLIEASGRAVGLPAGQMGNSEVGHLNIGAGRVVYQDITRIDKAIEDGEFFNNPEILAAMRNAEGDNKALHLVGLCSDGGVHSHINHLYALLETAKREKVRTVWVHCITDGRDVPPDSAREYVAALSAKIKELGSRAKIATVVGRYYYMDRDNRWERVERGYNCVFAAEGTRYTNADAGIAASYALGKFDEFIEPVVVGGYKGVNDGDSIIFFNFRSDRAREITRAALYADFPHFERKGGRKNVFYVGMTRYDESFTDVHTAFAPKDIKNTLGEYLASSGKTQARIAETEKYAHVTFFFNGGVEEPNKNEQRFLVPSPKVATYDLKPEMSAFEVTETALKAVGETDVIIMNYANCDMVGHTGVFNAAVKAVTAVDTCVKRVIDKILSTGGAVLLTADHGNAETMTFENGAPCTSHTTNPVFFILIGEKFKGVTLRSGGALCDVAPTLLDVMGLPKPAEMDGATLIER
ncbi:MAG: 2,3-bisphosphoglycerate-independent phosphoglycerate mutase [Clostridiales bacterium]|jgi:2,3-bisphosphoglycerate-independent phosphoglycerate mutase|nr:2,3-bisphosphoglycerate-independent phosphoglycerate mutase [Clostridiales bacterium]